MDRVAANPDLRALIAERVPHLLTYTADITRWSEPEFVLNIVVDVTGNRYLNPTAKTYEYSDALKLFGNYEGNVGYTLDENPLFVNPAIGDYRIREGVDFPDIEFEKIGRY